MELYQVTDIYLNAYLLADNFECEKTEVIKDVGRDKVAFYYLDSEELRACVRDFNDNDWLRKFIGKYLFTKREITRTLRSY